MKCKYIKILIILSIIPLFSLLIQAHSVRAESPKSQQDSMIEELEIDYSQIDKIKNDKADAQILEQKKSEKISSIFKIIYNEYFLIAIITITLFGIFLGVTEKIVVYRDYNDLGIIFLMGLFPFIISYLFMLNNSNIYQDFLFLLLSIAEGGCLLFVFARTYQDNNNIVQALIAFITKIPLSILFIVNLISFIAPTGKNFQERAKKRQSGLVWIMFLSPILFKLVRNKTGFFNPERTLRGRGMI